jgi:hypothetical protein
MTTKATPKTTKATPAPEAKAPSRTEMLATLKAKGYTGPTSFTASKLREVVAWVEAGSPKDSTNIPTGVLYAVYPDLKPVPKTKAARLTKFQQGYQGALAEVAALSDLASIQKWVADNRAQVEA